MTPARARRLRPLNTPRRIRVDCDTRGLPEAIIISRRRLSVEAQHEAWRIDDEWWRPKPISRLYWRVSLEDGRIVDVYHDRLSGNWFRQAYG